MEDSYTAYTNAQIFCPSLMQTRARANVQAHSTHCISRNAFIFFRTPGLCLFFLFPCHLTQFSTSIHQTYTTMHCTNPGPAPADITAKLSAVLAYAYEKNVESFFEPCLEIAYRLLHATAQAAKVPLFWPASCLEVLEPPEPFSRHCHDRKCSTPAPPPSLGHRCRRRMPRGRSTGCTTGRTPCWPATSASSSSSPPVLIWGCEPRLNNLL